MDTDAGKAWLSEQTKANIDLIQTYGFWPYLFQNVAREEPQMQHANAPIQTVSGPLRDPAEVMASMLDRKNQ